MDRSNLGRVVLRVGRFGRALEEAHNFGSESGDIENPWTPEFQAQSFELYFNHLSPSYLASLAEVFSDAANSLAVIDQTADSDIVRSYLRNAAMAIRTGLERSGQMPPSVERLPHVRSWTPPVVPFTQIAALVTVGGATRLRRAGEATHERLAATDHANPLDEEAITALKLLAAGYRVLDVATRLNVSERSMQRRLHDIRTALRARSTNDAIATAIRNGWI